MCYTDLDAPKRFRQEVVKARKEHTCCECGQPIPKGAHYQATSGLWDDSYSNYKTCARCHFARELIAHLEVEEGCGWGEAYPPFTFLAEAWHEMNRGGGRTAPLHFPDWPELKDVPRW